MNRVLCQTNHWSANKRRYLRYLYNDPTRYPKLRNRKMTIFMETTVLENDLLWGG